MDIIHTIEKALPILALIFVVVFSIIFLTRLVLTYILNQVMERYRVLKNSDKNFFKKKEPPKFKKEEDELLRKKEEIPRAHSAVKEEMRRKKQQSQGYELMAPREQENEKIDEMTIVDVVKPIGFWTSMILGQKLTFLIQSAQTINQRDKKGFWVSMIEAKDRAAGRQHGRGR
jgi:hypothetical protein